MISQSLSKTTAGLDGLRASNNSVTRGRPPVMSPALPTARGIFTKISPDFTFCPSYTTMCAPTGKLYCFISVPLLSKIRITGLRVLSRYSVIPFSL